jgi:hypothetical protein
LGVAAGSGGWEPEAEVRAARSEVGGEAKLEGRKKKRDMWRAASRVAR